MSLASLFSHRAVIERPTRSVASGGDIDTDWTQTAADVPCRLEVERVQVRVQPAGEIRLAAVAGFFPAGTDLHPGRADEEADRVTVSGIAYRVRSTRSLGREGARLIAADLEPEA